MMEMFDEEIATNIKADGTVEQKRWRKEDSLQSEAMEDACRAFVSAERKFQKLNSNPGCVTDPRLNLEWWDSLELLYRTDKTVWRLFVGPQPDLPSNMLYAKFRELLLKGGSLKVNA
jgi:hypothetical protein